MFRLSLAFLLSLLAVISITVLAAPALVQSADPADVVQPAVVEPVPGMDLTVAVQIAAVYPANEYDTAGNMYRDYLKGIYTKALSTVGDRALTENELVRLGVWEDSHGIEHSLRTLSMRMAEFYLQEGRLPANPGDVVTALGDNEWVRGDLYNPVTGDWYSGFTSTEWDCSAVNIEMFDDPAEARRILLERYPSLENDGVSDMNPDSALHMVVYGEEPGSVIFDDWFF